MRKDPNLTTWQAGEDALLLVVTIQPPSQERLEREARWKPRRRPSLQTGAAEGVQNPFDDPSPTYLEARKRGRSEEERERCKSQLEGRERIYSALARD